MYITYDFVTKIIFHLSQNNLTILAIMAIVHEEEDSQFE